MNAIDLREVIENRDTFLERLYFVLVKQGYRRDRGDITYIPINDTLEVQFKLDISDLIKDSKVAVFNDLIDRLDLDKKTLVNTAYDNTQRMLPARLESIADILPVQIDLDVPMYVLTNEQKTFGAGAILYSGMKERIEEVIGDFIVIPSSIHEVILVPEFLSGSGIVDIIRDVNRTTVSELEQLSDVPYKLIADGKLLEIEFAE